MTYVQEGISHNGELEICKKGGFLAKDVIGKYTKFWRRMIMYNKFSLFHLWGKRSFIDFIHFMCLSNVFASISVSLVFHVLFLLRAFMPDFPKMKLWYICSDVYFLLLLSIRIWFIQNGRVDGGWPQRIILRDG